MKKEAKIMTQKRDEQNVSNCLFARGSRRSARATKAPGMLLAALMLVLGASGCASSDSPTYVIDISPDGLSAPEQAQRAIDSVRANRSRLVARRDVLREAIIAQDPASDMQQLTCAEARLPHLERFARRAERAFSDFRDARRFGDDEMLEHRLAVLQTAARGASMELSRVRSCRELRLASTPGTQG